MLSNLLLLLSLWLGPESLVLIDTVDVIEHNRFYDEHGALVFEQAIFKEWDGERHQVRDWRLVKPGFTMLPTGCLFWDGDRLRRVTAKQVQHSWTQYDPELTEREVLPVCQRKGLTKR